MNITDHDSSKNIKLYISTLVANGNINYLLQSSKFIQILEYLLIIKKPKRKYIFTDALKDKYKILKPYELVENDGKIECISYGAIFSIDYGGKSDIKQQIVTKRHKLAEESNKIKKAKKIFVRKKFCYQ